MVNLVLFVVVNPDLKVQDINCHHKDTLKSYFEARSEPDSVVSCVAKGSFSHLESKVQVMKYSIAT